MKQFTALKTVTRFKALILSILMALKNSATSLKKHLESLLSNIITTGIFIFSLDRFIYSLNPCYSHFLTALEHYNGFFFY